MNTNNPHNPQGPIPESFDVHTEAALRMVKGSASDAAPQTPNLPTSTSDKLARRREEKTERLDRWRVNEVRRILALCAIGAVGLGAALLVKPTDAEPAQPPAVEVEVPQYDTYVVGEGDTLRNIALRIDSNRTTDEIVNEIKKINELDSSTIRIGQPLYIPKPDK